MAEGVEFRFGLGQERPPPQTAKNLGLQKAFPVTAILHWSLQKAFPVTGILHFPNAEFANAEFPFCIPESEFIEDSFTLDMLFDLDIDLDVIYYKDTGVTIFNNGSAGCKRLLPQIVDESKPIYLKDFLWARRVEIK